MKDRKTRIIIELSNKHRSIALYTLLTLLAITAVSVIYLETSYTPPATHATPLNIPYSDYCQDWKEMCLESNKSLNNLT